jgi:hypothetical protein
MKKIRYPTRREPPMTEAEWLVCSDPQPMLEFLRGRASDRKLRLFACACCRKLLHPFQPQKYRNATEAAERHADRLLTEEEVDAVKWQWDRIDRRHLSGREECEVQAVCGSLRVSAAEGASYAGQAVTEIGISPVGLLCCIFGDPFRPMTIDPAWIARHDGTIPKLAQAIYDDRHLPSGHLDPHRLAVLADVLEDAGCTDHDILAHCRGPGPHVRGCWVVDLMLGKE